ncbi:cyclin-dependent kinase F-4-like [Papaver somniferum]|uniref:cyclin-dependent kinase F-4-like n=1 Tax=Papaver somniferum TaxID=3469 RepID=UPI000E6FBC65|nr:cyclin-dependent kinase F-4-like [Papaver somniferum]
MCLSSARDSVRDLVSIECPQLAEAPVTMIQSSIPSPDMWAMGGIMAELLSLSPLFPGSSVIGSPTQRSWAELPGAHLSVLIPYASDDASNLISSLCSWDPNKWLTTSEALQHPFVQSCYYVHSSLRARTAITRTPPSGLFFYLWGLSCYYVHSSLRARTAITRTPPSVGTKETLDHRSSRRYSGTFSDTKPLRNFSSVKAKTTLSPGEHLFWVNLKAYPESLMPHVDHLTTNVNDGHLKEIFGFAKQVDST